MVTQWVEVRAGILSQDGVSLQIPCFFSNYGPPSSFGEVGRSIFLEDIDGERPRLGTLGHSNSLRGASDRKGKIREVEDPTAMMLRRAEGVNIIKSISIAYYQRVQKHHGESG